jgi:formate dehydrogenase maturation protein FdhE
VRLGPPSPVSSPRAESREIAELRRLRAEQPPLAAAIDFHIELMDMERRVRARVPLPRNYRQIAALTERLAAGRPLLQFEELPLDWSDFRRLFRETADTLRRHGMMEEAECQRVHALTRDGDALPPLARWWYNSAADPEQAGEAPVEQAEHLHHALLHALRPFLMRSAEAILPQVDLQAWQRGSCPLCGGDPDFSVWSAAGERQLLCGRCAGQWTYPDQQCVFCGSVDASQLRSFAGSPRIYRVDACDACHRYIKGFDGRVADRQMMLTFDAVATLPLDAAAIQRGYIG